MNNGKKRSLLVSTMDNGMKIVGLPIKGSRTISFFKTYKVGAAYEEGFGSGSNDGISHFLEHMTFKIKQKDRQDNIIDTFTGLGADINATTSFDMTFYQSKGPAKNFRQYAELWSRMLTGITIDREEFEAEKQVVLQEIKSRNDMPEGAVLKGALSNLFAGTPLQHNNLGSEESVAGITPEMMQDYVNTYYSPENSFVVVAGNFEWPNACKEIEQLFGKEKSENYRVDLAKKPWKSWKADWKGNHEAIIKPSNNPLTYVVLAWEMPGAESGSIYPQDLVNTLIGNSKTSLVYKEIIGRGVTSTLNYFADIFPAVSVGGLLYTAPPERVAEVHEKVIENILRKTRDIQVTPELVNRLKEEVTGSYILYIEDPLSLGFEITARLVKTGEEVSPEEYIDKIENVTTEEFRNVLNRGFDELEFTLNVIGSVPKNWEPGLTIEN